MRALCLVSLLLLACRTHTVPIGSVPAYAGNQPVVTREGYGLTLADGGTMELVPRDSTPCLEALKPPAGPRDIARVVAVADADFCRRVKLRGVKRIEAGPLLRLHSYARTIEVDPLLVDAVEVTGPRQNATVFAPRTELRSPAMIGAGAAVIGFNLAVALAWFLVDGTDAGPYVAVTAPLFVVWVGHSAGVGIPLIVLGSRPARLPQAQQPQAPAAQVGAIQVGDVGLRWTLD